ncbi:MAG: hypothetical protein DI535_05070 [Citrobacter freundii]|nr:MAG: hypothetical protein DI535_05070 [Citrobacter freundii]
MSAALIQKTAAQLHQLQQLLTQLSDEAYTKPVALLSNASIGQHTRHVIEFFQELNKGYISGHIDYDARQRDMQLETFRNKAIDEIAALTQQLDKPDRSLLLITVSAAGPDDVSSRISSNYYRELLYNLEHSVHHMALVRIAIQLLSSIDIPESFGVAEATIKFRQACAQ